MSDISQRCVDFIGNLLPLYQHEEVDERWCARSLRDGTVFLPQLETDQDAEDCWITVWWQGDPHRSCSVDGNQLASIALVEYVQFHCAGRPSEQIAVLLEDLSQHFSFKTGGSLYLPYAEGELPAFGKVLAAVKKYGPDLAWDALKKSLGL